MTRKQKRLLFRIIIAAVLFAAGSLLPLGPTVEMGVFLVCYAVIGWDIVWKAVTNILHGQVFDENFLMTIATIGALILGEHSEGVAVMLFYQVGEWFQSYAVSKSRKSIASLMDIRPDYANVERNGKLEQVDPDEVNIGDTIVVKPGERVPLDGKIIKGTSALDTSALTGESMPRDVEPGMEVISGCINQTGILTIQTTKKYGESTVAKILDLVENASDKKGKTENFISRFARYYTPIVVFAAIALAILPPLVTGQPFSVWIYRALTFLVISCPCALVISIPLSFFGGIGGASKIGVLVKGSNYLESLAHTEVVVFDKTGTLTKGSFAVSQIKAIDMKEEQLLELAAYAEDYSNHPISQSIRDKISFGFARITGNKDSNTAITTTPLPIPNSKAISVNCKETCKETLVSTEDSSRSCSQPEASEPRPQEPIRAMRNTTAASKSACKKMMIFCSPMLINTAISFCLLRIHIQSSRETITVPVKKVSKRISDTTLVICVNGAFIC